MKPFQTKLNFHHTFCWLTTTQRQEITWPSGQCNGLPIQWTQFLVLLQSPALFVFGHSEFKSSVTLVNIQLFASCQLGFLILLKCFIWIIIFCC